jgi:hypothetical protein
MDSKAGAIATFGSGSEKEFSRREPEKADRHKPGLATGVGAAYAAMVAAVRTMVAARRNCILERRVEWMAQANVCKAATRNAQGRCSSPSSCSAFIQELGPP